jgi:hypothetical protein
VLFVKPLGGFQKWILASVCCAVVVPVAADDCGAIPAFARKYRMSCTTCHAPVPRLKPYGEDFAGNAFNLEDKEPVRATYDTGDELLLLQRNLPLAVRFDAYFVAVHEPDDIDMYDFKTPWGLKILSGGNFSKHIGYYFYFYMLEGGEIAGIEDAYIHFNNFFGIDLDLMIGQFQVSDPLFKRELRLTYEDYEIYTVGIGNSPVTLTYDRGLMFTYGADFGLDITFEVVNGNGKTSGKYGNYDRDEWKNLLLRLSQAIGPVRAGAFGYYGKDIWRGFHGPSHINELFYWGVDATVDFGEYVQVNAQYLEREDDDPWVYLSPGDLLGSTHMRGGFVEAIWTIRGPLGRHFLTALYNHIEYNYARQDYRTGTASYTFLLRRNLRLVGEATYDDISANWRFVTGIVSAF